MTSILSVKPGHDGAIAFVDGDELVFSLEPEKDSGERHAPLDATTLVRALELCPKMPDIVAVGGWHKVLPGLFGDVVAGYRGLESCPSTKST
ncbi:MAG: proline dehydrogenase, partial [Actinomycetota bacterium]|nr:proline dehydrogenase [Actinomycetota bacterium]